MKIAALSLVFVCNSLAFADIESKLSCGEVGATEAKCQEIETQNTACDSLVQTEIKARIDAAKTKLDECKKKNSIAYLLKCKKEIKESSTAINTPKQIAASPIQKDLIAKADSPCAMADQLGKATPVCKSPKKVFELMKANCIKTP